MSYKCRCSKESCKRRRTFSKHPDEYKRPPVCHGCGGTKWRVDLLRQRRKEYRKCYCNGLWFSIKNSPHKWGTPGCDHREEFVMQAALAGRATTEAENFLHTV